MRTLHCLHVIDFKLRHMNSSKLILSSLLFYLAVASHSCFAQSDSANFQNKTPLPEIVVNIFPNPNRGIFYITLVNSEFHQAQLYSIDGRFIKMLSLQDGLNYIEIELPAGVYLLEIGEGETRSNYKIVVN